jgi:hypothetical protein
VKYVGIAALAATFWLLVATIRLVVDCDCRTARTAEMEAAKARVAVLRAALARSESTDCPGGPPGLPIRDPSIGTLPGTSLRRSALVAGMNALRPQMSACYCKYRVPGLAMVNVVIGKSGRVTSAVVTGKFAGTPTGSCVEAAVRTARFPASDGFATPYPFQLK